MPIMDEKIQDDIIKRTTDLFAKYDVDISKLSSAFWVEFFTYMQELSKQEGKELLTILKKDNLSAYTAVKNANLFGQVYTNIFTDLG